MYLRDEANNGRVIPIAIVGAALAFPGACDPVSFHELTIAGRRMFRELTGTTLGQPASAGGHAIAAPNGPPLRAALLDDRTAFDTGAAMLDSSRTTLDNPAASGGWAALGGGSPLDGGNPLGNGSAQGDGSALGDGSPLGNGSALGRWAMLDERTERRSHAMQGSAAAPGSAAALGESEAFRDGMALRDGAALRNGVPPGNGTALRNGVPPGNVAIPRHGASLGKPTADAADNSISVRHLLARRTAAAALTDVPPEGRSIGQGRAGVIIADNSEHGTPGVCAYVREQLGLAHGETLALAETRALSCSLRAVAAACDALDSGTLDLVLAGGVSVGIDPEWLSRRASAGSLAAEDVRVYDVSPTGTLPGEGCGVVVLMRAADARAAGLPVYAEIAGWNALEHAAPHGVPQPAAIRTAYLRAGVDPADIQFVEGHGAATEADDIAELTALLEVLSPRVTGVRGGCALGAVSANIGDTRAAAGVAALLKAALAMAAGSIPPTIGCVRPHPLLLRARAPFRLPAEPEPWPETGIQLAAVNSLGTADPRGGARSGPVHLVLRREQDPGRRPGRRRRAANGSHRTAPPVSAATAPQAAGAHTDPAPETLAAPVSDLLTARTTARAPALRVTAETVAETVVAVGGPDRADLVATLDAIALTADRLPVGELRQFALEIAAIPSADDRDARAAGARAAIVASDPAQLAERARIAAARLCSAEPGTLRAWPQTAGPGVYLAEGARGRVALVFPGLASTPLEHTTMLSASMATLSALDRLGVQPRLAVGHSFGEITGLAWAGCVTFGEAARLAAHRAQILRAAPPRTAMARVLADPRVVARLCSGTDLALAVSEGPRQQVLAGSVGDIRVLLRRAAALEVSADVLEVACALHSPVMQPCVAPLRAVIAGMRITAPRRRLISTITGLDVTVSEDIPGLLAGQITRPALLAGALALASADSDLILLASPEPAVASAAAAGGRLPVVQAPLERRSVPVPAALAALFAAGALSGLRPFLEREAAHAGREPADRSGYPGDPSRSQAGAPSARA